jgi:hypothetical protein
MTYLFHRMDQFVLVTSGVNPDAHGFYFNRIGACCPTGGIIFDIPNPPVVDGVAIPVGPGIKP